MLTSLNFIVGASAYLRQGHAPSGMQEHPKHLALSSHVPSGGCVDTFDNCESDAWQWNCENKDTLVYPGCPKTCSDRGVLGKWKHLLDWLPAACGGSGGSDPPATEAPPAPVVTDAPSGGDECVDTFDNCESDAWQWNCENKDTLIYPGCPKTCSDRGVLGDWKHLLDWLPAACGGSGGGGSPDNGGGSPDNGGGTPPTPKQCYGTNFLNDKVMYKGTFKKVPGLKYACNNNGLNNLYSRLNVPSRSNVASNSPIVAQYSNNTIHACDAYNNMESYRRWMGELSFPSCSHVDAQTDSNGDYTCSKTGNLSVDDAWCCAKKIEEKMNIRNDARSLGACVPDSVKAGASGNADNVKRVERIIDPLVREVPQKAVQNLGAGSAGTKYGWEALFPVHSKAMQMKDATRELVYGYDNFLRAVETFPAFCGKESGESEQEAETVCRRILATAFSHFVQETGGYACGEDNKGCNIYQGLWYNAEVGFGDANNMFAYKRNMSHAYANTSVPFMKWTPEIPGRVYPGRGPKQLTYAYNYGMASDSLFGNRLVLLEEPDLAGVGATPFMTSLWFFLAPQAPKPSMLEIIRKSGIVNDAQHNFGATTDVINGGIECGASGGNTQARRRKDYFEEFGKVFGLTNDVYYKNSMSQDACCAGCIKHITGGTKPKLWYDVHWDGTKCKTVSWQTPFLVQDSSYMGYKMCLEEMNNSR